MIDFKKDLRVVMTLDAGGTNFVFSAIKHQQEIVSPIGMPSNADNLEKCLNGMISGFEQVREHLSLQGLTPSAISFAFPGPADYPAGIIGDLGNLPAFRGGIALGAMLEERFGVPVFINNDGDLYALGESMAGALPAVNKALEEAGSSKRYKNLAGFTLGTGFGGGIVSDERLLMGDNSMASEVWLMSNIFNVDVNIEELISIRAVRKNYAKAVGVEFDKAPTPKDIHDIAVGKLDGNKEAALEAYRSMGRALGDALSNVMTIVDGIAVIGGGVAGAAELFMPSVVEQMNSKFGGGNPRLVQKVYNLNDKKQLDEFCRNEAIEVKVPFSEKVVKYDATAKIGVCTTSIGTSKAISIGAYSFALMNC